MSRIICLFCLLLIFQTPATLAHTVVSIKPLAMLHKALAHNNSDVKILLPNNQNLHDYAISIKDLRTLQQADVVFWLGGDNEHFLHKLEKKFATAHWYELASHTDHAWLKPQEHKALIRAMSQALIAENPEQRQQIEQQEQLLLKQLHEWQQRWKKAFKPYQGQTILLGHQAFSDVITYFGLKPAMYFAGHSHGQAQSGTQEILRLQQSIQKGDIRCAIEEPEVSFKQLKQRFSQLKTQYIDPNGGDISLNAQAFIELLESSNQAILACLQSGN